MIPIFIYHIDITAIFFYLEHENYLSTQRAILGGRGIQIKFSQDSRGESYYGCLFLLQEGLGKFLGKYFGS